MEKRNYVTSARTVETTDRMIDDAVGIFGTVKKTDNAFEKKDSAEDEKSDSSNS